MEIVNGLSILNTLFILLQCPCYMTSDCSTIPYKVLPRGYNIFMQTGVEPFFKPTKVTDRTKCVRLCAKELFCHIWRFDNGNCHIFHSMKDQFRVETAKIPSATTYYQTEKDETWFKMYFVKSESKFLVAESFMGTGAYESWGPEKCTSILCSDLFRSNLIDVWSNLPIHSVKMLARKDNKNVVNVIFDGKSSTKETWFSPCRVLSSPWDDLHNGTFVINPGPWGNFFMYLISESCPGGIGWFSMARHRTHCVADTSNSYPFIWYTNNTDATGWSDMLHADTMSIFVTLK